jgi:hypothetical protein
MIDRADTAESTEATLRKLPMEKTDPAEPMEPMDRTDPTELIDRIDPFELMDRMDPSDRRDRIEGSRASGTPPSWRNWSRPATGGGRVQLSLDARLAKWTRAGAG